MHLMLASAQIVAAIGTAVLSAPQPVAASTARAPMAQSSTIITGTVFQDYNSNGILNTSGLAPDLAIDAGVSGVTVSAFISGSLSAATTASTNASGAYTLTGLTSGTPYRVEFTGLPSGYYPSFHGADNGTSVQFAKGGSSQINFGINKPCDYCQNNPSLVTSIYQNADPLPAGSETGSQPALVEWPYTQTGNAAPATRATAAQIGATWGLAYQRDTQTLFSSAFVRRHAGLGPNGLGAIYKTDASGTSLLVDVNTLGANVGTLPSNTARGMTTDPDDPNIDAVAFDAVGKLGIGDIDLSENGQTLYFANLNERNIYGLNIGSPAVTPTLATRYDLPATACINGLARPWGLKFRDGVLYAGVVCTGENEPYVTGQITRTNANLSAMVYAMDTTSATPAFSATPVISFALSYAKGCAALPFDGDQRNCAWNPWTAVYSEGHPTQFGEFTYPSPILSGIDFDADGSMILAFSDRWGNQLGTDNYWPDGTIGEYAVEGGDLLRAWQTSSQQWTLESGGDKDGVGPYASSSNQTNLQGPGGGEFYYDEKLGNVHEETAMGALAVLAGSNQMIATINDPMRGNSAGTNKFNSTTGAASGGYELRYGKNTRNFGKAAGLGDLELLCNLPPIEIGNRVWRDDNANGIQDAGEPGLSGVLVSLQTPTTTLTTTTAADGTYYFGNLQANTAYTLTFPTTNKGVPLTTQNATGNSSNNPLNDLGDSDTNAAGVITFSTGGAGENNHTLDVGYGALPLPAQFGDRVWIESDADGIANTGSLTPVAGIVITATGANGAVFTTTTNAAGYYSFTVAAGTYTVTYGAIPASYGSVVPSSTPAGNTESGNAGSFAQSGKPDQSHANNTTVTVAAGQANWHVDFAFTPASATFGNFVWVESDTDGIASTGTITPVVGKVITATDQTGMVFTQTTNAQGYYTFTVPVGVYTVNYGTAPAGTLPSATPNGNTANGATQGNDQQSRPNGVVVTLVAGDVIPTIDFGFHPTAGLGDFVWEDLNHDGQQNSNEPGIQGVTVTLYANGVPVGTTTTNASGGYSFTNLTPGLPYSVGFSTPAGYLPTQHNVGNDVSDSDANVQTGATQTVTLSAGEFNPTLDAGFWRPAALGDYVWADENTDGQQDSNEPGVNGVAVTLYLNGVPISSTTTYTFLGHDGYYTFTHLISGTYSVTFGLPAGYLGFTTSNVGNDAGDSDANTLTGATGSYVLNAGEQNPTVDAGLIRPAGLGDTVWQDYNHNGVQEAGEPGVGGVTVTLQTPTTTLTTHTDSNGTYSFTNLLPGAPYTVSFTAPAGYTFTLPNIGNDTTDSDANVSSGQTPSVTLKPGEFNSTIDAGLWQPMALGNYVWIDTNNNGLNDEPASNGVNGVSVNLYLDNGDGILGAGDSLISTTTTTNGGYYLFTHLISGTYLVQIPSSNFAAGAPLFNHTSSTGNGVAATNNNLNNDDDGEPQGSANNIVSRPVTLTPGQEPDSVPSPNGNTNLSVDFGFFPYASLGDRVWFDVNANGIQDTNEMTGVAGVQVVLYSPLTNQPIATTTTDANGIYSFTQLIPSDYFVQFDLPAGWTRSPQNANGNTDEAIDSDADVTTGRTAVTTLVAGENDLTWDAGIYYTASLGDRMWEDLNRNGLQDAGEPGVSGVLVTLFANGQPISTTTTDATGFYQFSDLTPSVAYSVGFGLPAGYQFTTPNVNNNGSDAADSDVDSSGSTQVVILAPNEHNPTLDAGIWRPAGIGDRVWLDNDRDGVQGSNEPGVPNVPVTLYQNGIAISTTTTDAQGNYSFTGLIPGTYSLTFGLPAGYDRTQQDALGNSTDAADSDTNVVTGATATTTLVSGEYDPTWDMGVYQLASLGDYVWIDANRNGQQDSGETPVPNVRVVLHDANGTAIMTTTTDSNGFYNFTNLQPGNYTVQFDLSTLPAHYVPTTQGPNGSSDAADSDADVTGQTELITLSAGENDLTWDMGIYLPTAGLGDYVWVDTNRDGQQQAGEPVLPGVLVTLYTNGSPISTTTTNSSGAYSFANLLPGVVYTLQFSLPPGFAWTQPLVGAPATDSNVNDVGQTGPVTLAPDEFNPTIDAGVVSAVVLGKVGIGSGLNNSIGSDNLITYTLTITNNGKMPISGLVVSDVLPSNLEYVRNIGVAPSSINPLSWSLDTLQAGEVRTLSFVAEVKNNATGVENIAYVLGPMPNASETLVLGRAIAVTPRGPTAVTLLVFTAKPATNGVLVAWQTGAEINTFGFALYRSESADRAKAVLVTKELIAAHGTGDYSFNDLTAQSGVTYHYWLIEAEVDGTLIEYGPAIMSPTTSTSVVVNSTTSGTQTWNPNAVIAVGGVSVANVPVANVPTVNLSVAPATQVQGMLLESSAPAQASVPVEQGKVTVVANTTMLVTSGSVNPAVAQPAAAVQQVANNSDGDIEPAALTNDAQAIVPPAANMISGNNGTPQVTAQAQPENVASVKQQPPASMAAQPQAQKLSPVLVAAGIAGLFVTLCLMGLGGVAFILSRKRQS